MLSSSIIKKAVFPIAGLGTRFLPITKSSPKEMLPIVDKPLIQYAVEEAYASGIRQMIFVTGRDNRAVEEHFDTSFELEATLEHLKKHELLSLVRSVKPSDMECVYIRQPKALGLGHAILCAEKLVGNEPFAVLLADDLIIGKPPILTQMIAQFEKYNSTIIAIENIPKEHIYRYGIISGKYIDNFLLKIENIVEKPTVSQVFSTLGVVGRYILMPSIFKELAKQMIGINGEIHLTDALREYLNYERCFAYQFNGVRYDCGSKVGFLKASVDMAIASSTIGDEFISWLKQRVMDMTVV